MRSLRMTEDDLASLSADDGRRPRYVACPDGTANTWPDGLAASHFPTGEDPSWSTVFPSFILALCGFIAAPLPTFCDVELQTVINPATADLWHLSPHCQCSFLATTTQSPSRNQAPRRPRDPPRVDSSQFVPCRARKPLAFYKGDRTFNVPAWVINTHKSDVIPHAPRTFLHEPAPLRFHLRDPKKPYPLGVPPRQLHFRNGIRVSDGGHLFSWRHRSFNASCARVQQTNCSLAPCSSPSELEFRLEGLVPVIWPCADHREKALRQ
jgi:hypothetical protein